MKDWLKKAFKWLAREIAEEVVEAQQNRARSESKSATPLRKVPK